MSNPIDPAAIRPVQPQGGHHPEAAGPGASRTGGPSFAEVLRGPGKRDPVAVPERMREMMRDITRGERYVDRMIAQASSGRDFSVTELIGIQARVYRYTQELELFSKMVDKTCSGVRQTLQTQV
ncbi:MAG: type III secretion apparatus protein [Deltaproteobacteria bacterium]|nr:type III secretion apparatus protein [Deltaproteobacteria bacterium]